MEITKPPSLRGMIRLQHAEEGLNPELPRIVCYDVNATITYESQKLLLKFNFKPNGYYEEIFFENAVNVKTDEQKPHIRNAQFFKTGKSKYVLHATFVFTNFYGEETDSWEVAGKFKGQMPRAIECWDFADAE